MLPNRHTIVGQALKCRSRTLSLRMYINIWCPFNFVLNKELAQRDGDGMAKRRQNKCSNKEYRQRNRKRERKRKRVRVLHVFYVLLSWIWTKTISWCSSVLLSIIPKEWLYVMVEFDWNVQNMQWNYTYTHLHRFLPVCVLKHTQNVFALDDNVWLEYRRTFDWIYSFFVRLTFCFRFISFRNRYMVSFLLFVAFGWWQIVFVKLVFVSCIEYLGMCFECEYWSRSWQLHSFFSYSTFVW